jgi:murein DD-endopeptidase MepM/ murein hydrolase activator NlpD
MGRPPSSGRFPGRPFLLAALLLAASSGRAEPYTVQPGDTLSSLARRLGTTAAALAERNGLPVGPLRVGQVLDLPPDPSAATAVSSPSGVRVSLPASAAPGDPVTVRVSGTALAPTVTWGEETLVVAVTG